MALIGTIPSTANVVASAITGTIAGARLPAGSVLQVVQTTTTQSDGIAISSSAGSTTVLSLSITPSSTSSKILICMSGHFEIGASETSAGSLSCGEKILRNSTEVYGTGEKWFFAGTTQQFEAYHVQYLDSPATTSSITYNYQLTPTTNRGRIRFCRNGTAMMQLLEIAG